MSTNGRNVLDLFLRGVVFVVALHCALSAQRTQASMLPDKPAGVAMRGTEAALAEMRARTEAVDKQLGRMDERLDKHTDQLREVQVSLAGIEALTKANTTSQTAYAGGFGIIALLEVWRRVNDKQHKAAKAPIA